jgi:hypothetical protein
VLLFEGAYHLSFFLYRKEDSTVLSLSQNLALDSATGSPLAQPVIKERSLLVMHTGVLITNLLAWVECLGNCVCLHAA